MNHYAKILADFAVLAQKARNYHWNTTGPFFFADHALYDGQYDFFSDKMDEIAEHVRGLGLTPPSTYAEFLKLTDREEGVATAGYLEMRANLLADIDAVRSQILEKIEKSLFDTVGEDMMIAICAELQKSAWMIRSSLAQ